MLQMYKVQFLFFSGRRVFREDLDNNFHDFIGQSKGKDFLWSRTEQKDWNGKRDRYIYKAQKFCFKKLSEIIIFFVGLINLSLFYMF